MAESVLLAPERQTPTFALSSPPADPWKNMVSEMAMSAVIQKHTNLPTATTTTFNPITFGSTLVKSVIVPTSTAPTSIATEAAANSNNNTTATMSFQVQAVQPQQTSGSFPQGYINVNSFTSQAGTGSLPLLTQNFPGGTQLLQGTPITLPQLTTHGQLQASTELGSQTPIMHLTPVGYTPTGTVDGNQLLSQGFWYACTHTHTYTHTHTHTHAHARSHW